MGGALELHDVSEVEVVGEHRLRLTFDDGTVGEVEFADREWRGVLEPLADPGYFALVRVDREAGTIAWPKGVDLAPEGSMRKPGATRAGLHRAPTD